MDNAITGKQFKEIKMDNYKMRLNIRVQNGETMADWLKRTGGSGSQIEEPYVPRTLSDVLLEKEKDNLPGGQKNNSEEGPEKPYVAPTLSSLIPRYKGV